MEKIKISPSLMCVNYLHLERIIKELESAGVDMLHFDIMDGHFVPNFTMGPDILKSVREITSLPFDIHLMISEPDKYIQQFVEVSNLAQGNTENIISVHIESCIHLHRVIQVIKNCGAKASVALNPTTSLSTLDYILEDISMVLLMMVEPGFAGQKLISGVITKIKDLKKIIDTKKVNIDIEVDGNVSYENIPIMVEAGANVLVAGTSSLFKKDIKIKDGIKRIQELVASYIKDNEENV
ncbi:MAG: ribulose-phosphate 3-epimerase [Candidatus Firestonebacteria bacterium]